VIDQFSGEKSHSWSFFGNIDLNPTDTIKISGGVRNISRPSASTRGYT